MSIISGSGIKSKHLHTESCPEKYRIPKHFAHELLMVGVYYCTGDMHNTHNCHMYMQTIIHNLTNHCESGFTIDSMIVLSIAHKNTQLVEQHIHFHFAYRIRDALVVPDVPGKPNEAGVGK